MIKPAAPRRQFRAAPAAAWQRLLPNTRGALFMICAAISASVQVVFVRALFGVLVAFPVLVRPGGCGFRPRRINTGAAMRIPNRARTKTICTLSIRPPSSLTEVNISVAEIAPQIMNSAPRVLGGNRCHAADRLARRALEADQSLTRQHPSCGCAGCEECKDWRR